jgi:hypothetical protein
MLMLHLPVDLARHRRSAQVVITVRYLSGTAGEGLVVRMVSDEEYQSKYGRTYNTPSNAVAIRYIMYYLSHTCSAWM